MCFVNRDLVMCWHPQTIHRIVGRDDPGAPLPRGKRAVCPYGCGEMTVARLGGGRLGIAPTGAEEFRLSVPNTTTITHYALRIISNRDHL